LAIPLSGQWHDLAIVIVSTMVLSCQCHDRAIVFIVLLSCQSNDIFKVFSLHYLVNVIVFIFALNLCISFDKVVNLDYDMWGRGWFPPPGY
jgi:hypothetical protein